MLKGILGILLFVFFLIIFIVMLIGGRVLKAFRTMRKAAELAADKEAQRQRYETGRQRQQYSQRQQATNGRQTGGQQEERETRRTQTATGDTIIDMHHQKRENRKIFEDGEGEYVDFEEA